MRPRHAQRGQTLAEFALAFPIFMLILFGLFDIGRAVYAYNAITNAAREGARLAIVNQDLPSIEGRAADMSIAVAITATVDFNRSTPEVDAADNAACATLGIGCIAIVGVTTDFRAMTPVIGNLMGPITLRAETQIPVEFVCPNPLVAGFTTVADCPRQQ